MNCPCCCCGKPDVRTQNGALFCHSCSENASEKTKEELFCAYVSRMASLQQDFKDWERKAA